MDVEKYTELYCKECEGFSNTGTSQYQISLTETYRLFTRAIIVKNVTHLTKNRPTYAYGIMLRNISNGQSKTNQRLFTRDNDHRDSRSRAKLCNT